MINAYPSPAYPGVCADRQTQLEAITKQTQRAPIRMGAFYTISVIKIVVVLFDLNEWSAQDSGAQRNALRR